MKEALQAIAQLTRVDIKDAMKSTRQHPLWGEEIHIEEELINLEEAFATAIAAGESLRTYPEMRNSIIREQRTIIRHCVGLVARMTKRKQLPREYNHEDTVYAMTKLIRLIIKEALRVGKEIDDVMLQALKPYLSFNQRRRLNQWTEFSPRLELQLLRRRLVAIRQFE